MTATARNVHALVAAGRLDDARAALPAERPYPLPEPIAVRLSATSHEPRATLP